MSMKSGGEIARCVVFHRIDLRFERRAKRKILTRWIQ